MDHGSAVANAVPGVDAVVDGPTVVDVLAAMSSTPSIACQHASVCTGACCVNMILRCDDETAATDG